MSKFLLHTLFMLLQGCSVMSSAHTAETDREALLEFKSQLSRESTVALASWNHHSLHLCNWTGVTCGRKHERVTHLRLASMKLAGVISPSIGNLSFLRSLDLSGNSFHGSIPQAVGKLARLRFLNMSGNLLGGGIPPGLSNCSSLLRLDLMFNRLTHNIPPELGSLSKLVILRLSKNQLTGRLPPSLGNLTSLENFAIAYNQMEGEIPGSFAKLSRMESFQLAVNNFSGDFPNAFRNLSSLEFISIGRNNFSGELGFDFGTLFPNLQFLYIGGNYFTGTLAAPFSNVSTLRNLELSENNFVGSIPSSLSRNRNLELLGISQNSLGSYAPTDLDFLGGFSNCTQLKTLDFGYNNRLGGSLPNSVANLSTQMTAFIFGGNYISGAIPPGIGNLANLQSLGFERNRLSGKLPASLGKLSSLVTINGNSNNISGELPSFFGNMTRLESLFLFKNGFEGRIPPDLKNCSYLQYLGLYSNQLAGAIPRELMDLPSLMVFDVSYNSLVGALPDNVGNLKNVITLQVLYNNLSGQIPQTLGNCLNVIEIFLQGNSFVGVIPYLGRLKGLQSLDLSDNGLSGIIPEYLVNSSLQYLNLSMNDLEGAVPMTGVFRNVGSISIFGNKNLCGGIPELKLKPCSTQIVTKPKRRSLVKKKVAIVVSVGVTLVLLSFMIVISLYRLKKRKNQNRGNNDNSSALDHFYERISYEELQNATDGFSSNNIIGSGHFSTVFKGVLGSEGKAVAVKVLNLLKSGAAKSFMAECETLKGIRHRNLVKLLTVCSSIDFNGNEFRALVYEFMPNGSLDTWLHQGEVEVGTGIPTRTLNLRERLNIIIDVASALVHLHGYCHDPVAHCDLKPSNVLLDGDLTAHVSDFGLARLLGKFDQESSQNQYSSANIRGTIGYMAPEYGMGSEPSVMGDVYSFGVLVLEMLTGKRPTDELFSEDFTLHNYARSALPERVMDIIDQSILYIAGARTSRVSMAECLAMVLEVGIRCSEESPTSRMAIDEAVNELVSIRKRFFKTNRAYY